MCERVREIERERTDSPYEFRVFESAVAAYPVGFHHSRFLFFVQFGFQTVERFQETLERFFRAKLRAVFASVAVEERREDEFNESSRGARWSRRLSRPKRALVATHES